MADLLLWDHDVRLLTGRTPEELDLEPVMLGSSPKYRQSDVYQHATPHDISYWESMSEDANEGERHELQNNDDAYATNPHTSQEVRRHDYSLKPSHHRRRRRRAGWTRV